MYEFYNPHPQEKLVGDCVKRAITKASGKTYQEVSKELNRIKRNIEAKAYNSNKVWTKYVEENLHGIKKTYPPVKGQPRMNGHTFCEKHPKGVYILNMARHLACCVDGVIYDTWDCRDKCVYNAYEIPQDASKLVPVSFEEAQEFLEEVSADAVNDITDVAASKPPKEYRYISGNEILRKMAELVDVEEIKKTKKNELWISLNGMQYGRILQELLTNKSYLHFRWDTKVRKGVSKAKIWDEKSGMTLVLKSGTGAYLWCTNNGKGDGEE